MKTCNECGQEKGISAFYKGHDTCRSCIQLNAVRGESLDVKVERHRQEKLLREELKKIAKQRMEKKAKQKRVKAREKLIPKAAEPIPGVEVDPAIQELARRTLGRRRLIEFVKMFHPRYLAGWVHHDICRRLEAFAAAVDRGESPRLMILMPPRHGKSQIASKLYPAWHLGHYPHHEFITCSYNISLAMDFSREVRDVIASEEYGKLFPKSRLDPDRRGAESWKLLSPSGVGAGGYNAAGVEGGITGKGAHVLVIDDPFKNTEEADNPDHREKVWNWYLSSAYNRLAPGGGILVIQTWWHDDDLAGRLQTMMKENPDDPLVDKWDVVKYPALAEEDEEFRMKGEALHPARYDVQQLLRIQRQYGGPTSRYWSALYQQNPVPNEGAYFTKPMFRFRDDFAELEGMNIIQTWDLAITEKKVNDWTVGTTVAVDHTDRMHVLEQRRFRTNDAGRIIDEMIDMYVKYPTVAGFGVEDGQIWRTMKPLLIRRMEERRVYIPLDDERMKLSPVTDKLVRARPLQGRMQIGKVTFPRGQEWVDVFMKEALRFPGGTHDDTIDSLAWAAILATRISPPDAPKMTGKRPEKTVAELISAHVRGQNGSNHLAY